ncbi:phosphoribosyltransferase [Actinomadura madurae]|uniref:phosphoribosyltransferase n=1 Tax=Actinomadura madurae TaxID=1993 RepID=UPI000DD0956A|nr:phosphoribosyltransferase family protein [Actinomadura madurae]
MFVDRRDAGRQLAVGLRRYAEDEVLVVGLYGGGALVAAETAAILGAPLDVLVVRELALPERSENVVGAIAEDGAILVDEDALKLTKIGAAGIRTVEQRLCDEAQALGRRLREGRPPGSMSGREVIVVDDGTASRISVEVACRAIRAQGAGRVVFVVPAASPATVDHLETIADQVVCLLSPAFFIAASHFYLDFGPVAEDEVVRALRRAAERTARFGPAPGGRDGGGGLRSRQQGPAPLPSPATSSKDGDEGKAAEGGRHGNQAVERGALHQ